LMKRFMKGKKDSQRMQRLRGANSSFQMNICSLDRNNDASIFHGMTA